MSRGKRNAPKLPDGDDGRTIVPMDVDGMPWHIESTRDPFRAKDGSADDRPPMAKNDRRAYLLAAVGAGLLIAAVFAVGYALFLLFCRFVWLR